MDIRFATRINQHHAKERLAALTGLFHSWADFTETNNLVYWLAHGTLIGWSWNHKILPYDFDLDIQTTSFHLQNVMARFNQTKWDDRYFFDVNPFIKDRKKSVWNVIDARWIDMKTGFYIDITGLTVDPKNNHVCCKTPHYYPQEWISPLRKTIFEGRTAWRPNNTYEMLNSEYRAVGDPFHRARFGVHWVRYVFNFGLGLWERKPLPTDRESPII